MSALLMRLLTQPPLAALPTTLRIAKVDDDGNDCDDDEYESNNDGAVEPIDKDTPKDKNGDKT